MFFILLFFYKVKETVKEMESDIQPPKGKVSCDMRLLSQYGCCLVCAFAEEIKCYNNVTPINLYKVILYGFHHPAHCSN